MELVEWIRGEDVKDSRDQSRRAHCIKTEETKKNLKVLRLKREDLHISRCTGFCFTKKSGTQTQR